MVHDWILHSWNDILCMSQYCKKGIGIKEIREEGKNKEPEKETLEILFQGHSHCIVAFVLLIYYQVHVLTDTSQTWDSWILMEWKQKRLMMNYNL